VGQPWIGAGKGSEVGNWAKCYSFIHFFQFSLLNTHFRRWYAKHPLHLSSSPTPIPAPPTPSSSMTRNPSSPSRLPSMLASPPPAPIPIQASISDSYTDHDPQPPTSFTTAVAMLLYNVSYLAHTQSVDVPLSQAGDVLSNLWSVCCSSELGRLAPPSPSLHPTLLLDN
jgi:hypothetical protein